VDDSFAQGLIGVTLDGRYRLDAVLGEGGMGSVFRATHVALDRKVAVKLLKPHLTSDHIALERFAREARATRKVESPHAVKVLDFGVTPLGDYYMVLEYLDGRTVQRELEIDGPFAPARVAHIARQALHALGIAHAQGLIHRDVKPDNLLLMRVGGDSDYTKILDFGVAKLMQGDPAQLALTAAGMVFGTPEFMSPEQACGQPLDGRSDLYSLAATMFVMLTGTGLFEGTTAIEWLTHHARTPPPRLAMARPELAAYPELDALLQRCLAKHRDQRPESAGELARLLGELAPALARPGGPGPGPLAAKPTPSRPSSYVQVLRDGNPAHSTAAIAAPAAAAAVRGLTTTSAGSASLRGAPTRPARRRLSLWAGGVAVASLIGVAVGLSVQRSGPRAASTTGPAPAVAAVPADAGAGAGKVTEEPVDAGPRGISLDAAATAAPPAPHTPRNHAAPPVHSAAADEYLRNAEDAYQSNNVLRQFTQADFALRANPRSARARYLVGDALIKSGDLDRGCSYLAPIKQLPAVRARARAAGCPGD